MSAASQAPTVDVSYVVSKARTRLVARLPFLGRIAMNMAPRAARPEDGVKTAGIARDGTAVFNAEYLATLSDKEIAGVVAHEALHPALQFWARKGNRHHLLANIAHDLSFNFWIEEMACGEIELPKGSLLDQKFHGMSMEEIYAYLLKGDNGSGKTTIKCKGGGQITIDTKGGGGDQYGDCRDDLAESPGGKKASRGDRSAQKKLESEWKMTLAEAAQHHEQRSKSKGTLPAGLRRYIEELLHPKLDWTELLRKWCGENGRREDYSFLRPNRRSYSLGTILPSQCAGGYADVVFLLDSSGSMSQREIRRGLSEAQGILEEMGCEIRVIVCDAAVHTDMSVEEACEIEVKGGGGSNFCPAFELLDEDGFDGAVVAFTDGMIDVPPEMPVNMQGTLWVTTGDYKPPTETWGEHISIPDDKDDEEEY